MTTPNEGQRVMAKFEYQDKVVEAPVTFRSGQFIVDFYTSEFPVHPISWKPIEGEIGDVIPEPIVAIPMVDKINFEEVIKMAMDEVSQIVNGTYHDDTDDKEYLYEAVMQAVYGQNYFDWKNKNTD